MSPVLAVILLTLAQGAPPDPAAPAPTVPAVAPPTTPSPAPAPADPAADLAQLQQLYQDTCLAREYGAYDDMCDQLRQQVRAAERNARAHSSRGPTDATPQAPPRPGAS